MKKRYSKMEIAVIPVDNDVATSSTQTNCVITTQLEDSDGQFSSRCDITSDDMIQREWFGNNEGLQVTLSIDDCYS